MARRRLILLHKGFCRGNHSACKLWADLEIPDDCGATPAYIAASEGHNHVITALASLGADLNKQDIIGTTPASIAACFGHDHVIKELASHEGLTLIKQITLAGRRLILPPKMVMKKS